MFDVIIILTTFFLGFALATTRYIGGYKLIEDLRADKANLTEALEMCEARCTKMADSFKDTSAWAEIATMVGELADMERENEQLKRELFSCQASHRNLVDMVDGLTAELAECQQAFNNGRAVGAVVGELEY